MQYLTLDWEHLPQYGSCVCMWEGVLIETAMPLVDNIDDWYEVTAPQSQEYLNAVNDLFGTDFMLEDFAGR